MNQFTWGILIGMALVPWANGSRAYDHQLACAKLLTKFNSTSAIVPPHRGSPVTEDIPKDLTSWIKGKKGRLSRLDKGEGDAEIYRWSWGTGGSVVIKAFADKEDAHKSDDQFRLLAEVLPKGILHLVQQLGKARTLRFFDDIEGITLEELIESRYYSSEINSEIVRLYGEHLKLIREQIIKRFGAKNVTEYNNELGFVRPSLQLEIKTSTKLSVIIFIHDQNVVFESQKKRFWIIDPE